MIVPWTRPAAYNNGWYRPVSGFCSGDSAAPNNSAAPSLLVSAWPSGGSPPRARRWSPEVGEVGHGIAPSLFLR